MDRALDLEALRQALGQHQRLTWPGPFEMSDESSDEAMPPGEGWLPILPTPEELQRLLARTEVQLFLNQRELPYTLLTAGWYLHGIASANSASEVYSAERQRRAFAISAHIFDLATLLPERPLHGRLTYAFAAQIGYHRSEQEPNAIAVGRRVSDQLTAVGEFTEKLPTIALRAGIALLSLNVTQLQSLTRVWQEQLRQLARDIGIDDLASTMFGPTYCVVEGVMTLARFLARGDRYMLNRAREFFEIAVRSEAGEGDHNARWVAAHLRFIADEMDAGSVWSLLPPDLPSGAKQAFTLTPPYVLTLWKPQRELLAPQGGDSEDEQGEVPNALDAAARRIILSVPTSAGKTLLAQLILVTHLAASRTGVCYVAPQRSLGREVRKDLGRRLRVLAREVGRDEPDFQIPPGSVAALLQSLGTDPFDLTDSAAALDIQEPDVDIMTPERLARVLRNDAQDVLNRYGLFVFDEAHLIGEASRGLLTESILSFLHWRTKDTQHRIVLLSAALGNLGQLAQWLQTESPPNLLQSDWRGPRRLHAIFNTDLDWDNPTVTKVTARGSTAHLTRRLSYDTYGVIRLRPAEDHPAKVRTSEPIGITCFRATASGERAASPEPGKGTPFYRMLADTVRHIGHAGPVLIIRNTRSDAVAMAQALAIDLPEAPPAHALAEFAQIRLGHEHPLPELLRKGVAYHHAGLPIDLQDSIEEAIRSDALSYIVATSTLTDGVNLPVRTVVIATLPYEGQPIEQQLTGARLINAIGRAGRAAKESEGWVILARAARPQNTDFALFEPEDDELEVCSRLLSDEALSALAIFEETVRAGEDALIAAGSVLADFVAFVWFVLAAEEEVGRVSSAADPLGAFACTLAYSQLAADVRSRYEAVVGAVNSIYQGTDPDRRRRWAKTGTSIATARMLDELANVIAVKVEILSTEEAADVRGSAQAAIRFLDRLEVFDRLLELPERPKEWSFHHTASTRSPRVSLRPAALLESWIGGVGLAEMADDLLYEIPDRPFRLERLVDTVTDFCEHYFSWMLGALLGIVNGHLDDHDTHLFPDLPLFVRYGVTTPTGVHLLLSGIRSREFAVRIAVTAMEDDVDGNSLRAWLNGMTLGAWRTRFDATPADLADLLEYCRPRGSHVLRTLLNEGTVTITVQLGRFDRNVDEWVTSVNTLDRETGAQPESGQHVVLHRQSGAQRPVPIAVYSGALEDGPIAIIPTSLHSEVESVLDTGLALEVSLLSDQLTISLEE